MAHFRVLGEIPSPDLVPLDEFDELIKHSLIGGRQRNTAALIIRRFRQVLKPLVLFAYQIPCRHAHIGEVHDVYALPVHADERREADARSAHVHDEQAHTLAFRHAGIREGGHEDMSGVVGNADEHFLAIDDVLIPIRTCRGVDRGEVGAGIGLGPAQAGNSLQSGDGRQEPLFLLFRTDHHQPRPNHVSATVGYGPALPAVFLRPVHDIITVLNQLLVKGEPSLKILFRHIDFQRG